MCGRVRGCSSYRANSMLLHLSSAFAVFLAIFALSGTAFAACPGTISADYTMSTDETATASCFIIATQNITLDCAGKTITMSGAYNVPIIDVNARNVTIKNCIIAESSATNYAQGAIYLRSAANNTTIMDTNITTAGHYAMYVESSYNNFSNVRTSTTTQNAYAWRMESSSYNTLTDVQINKTATANTYLMYWNTGTGNTFENHKTYSPNGLNLYGTYLYGVTNSRISNSNFTCGNTYYSLYFVGGSNNNNVSYTNFTSAPLGTCGGAYIDTSMSSTFTDSIFYTNGVSIYVVSSAGYNTFDRLNVTSNGSTSFYFQAGVVSDYNVINNTNSTALGYALSLHNSRYNTVTNSLFNSTSNNALYSDTGTNNNLFFNNSFESRRTAASAYAMYFVSDSSSNTIANNTIVSPTFTAIYFGLNSMYNLIDNNTIEGRYNAAQYGMGVAFAAVPCDGNNITNNNITTSGISVQITGNDNLIANNTIYSNVSYGIYLYTSNTNTIADNFVNASTYGVYLYTSGYNNVTNNNVTTWLNYPLYLATSADYNIIRGNLFNSTNLTASANNRNSLYMLTSSNNLFDLNQFYAYGDSAVRLSTAASSNNFTNNTIYSGVNSNAYFSVYLATNNNNNKFFDNNITAAGTAVRITATCSNNNFTGGTIESYNGYGIYIDGSSNNNFFANQRNISSGLGANGNPGVYITGASGTKVRNTSIFSNTSYGVHLASLANTNEFSRINISSRTSTAVYLQTNVKYNQFREFNMTSTGLAYALVVDGSANPVESNNFTNGSMYTNFTNGYTLYLYYANFNNFTNVSITNSVYRAAYLLAAQNNIFSNCDVTASSNANSWGIYTATQITSPSLNNQFINCTITAPASTGGYDLYTGNTASYPSNIVMVNTNFDKFGIAFGDVASYVNVSWYANAYVTDLTGTFPIEGANVTIYNSNGALSASSLLTNSSGHTQYAALQEYMQTSGGSTTYTPHTFNTTTGSAAKSQSNSIITTTTVPVLINATTCRFLSGDYTLTNNVYASTDCFSLGAPSLTVNCAGYTINYSRSGAGCGLTASSLIGLNVLNCTFAQGAYGSQSSGAICLTSSSNLTLSNSTISARGSGNGYDFILSSSYANAYNTTLNTTNSNLTGTSTLGRGWYLRVNMTDLSGNPVETGTANITDVLNQSVASATITSGTSSLIPLLQYLQTGASNYTYFSNYSIFAYVGFANNTTSINLTGNSAVTIAVNASVCGLVNGNIMLNNNVNANGTCFVANSSSITIDCNNYAINYSRNGDGFFALDTQAKDDVTLKNCNIHMGNSSAVSSYGIFVNQSANFKIYNSTIYGNSAIVNGSSINAELINTIFDNSTLNVSDGTSNMSVRWYADLYAVGLANEDVNGSQANATNVNGQLSASGTTNATGHTTFLLTEYVKTQFITTHLDPYNFSALHPETLVSNFTISALNSTSNITVGLISASIDFISPNASQIFFQGDSVPILVNETKGTSWLTNVTVEVLGDTANATYQAAETSPGSNIWSYDYSIQPSQPSSILTMNARGYNGSTYVSATRSFIVTRTSGSGVSNPVISYFCPNYTYVTGGRYTNITVSADLDTVLFALTLNVTYPNSTDSQLSPLSTSSDTNEFLYNRTWQLYADQVGTYSLFVQARDVNDNRVNSTYFIYASAANSTINLSSNGATSMELRDVCSNTLVLSGASFEGASVAPGNYTLVAENSAASRISLLQLNVTSFNGTFLNYSEVSGTGITPPTNRRTVLLLNASAYGPSYSGAQARFNYTSEAGTLVAENSMEIYSCATPSSCSWLLEGNFTLNTTSNIANATIPNVSGMYGLFEPAYTTPAVILVTIDAPSVSLLTTDYANVETGDTVTVYFNTDLDAPLGSAQVNVTRPSGTSVLANISYVNGSNYTYNYTYQFSANETGMYTIRGVVSDNYTQTASANAMVTVNAAQSAVQAVSYGALGITVSDPGTDMVVLNATADGQGVANASGNLLLGTYTVRVNTTYVQFAFTGLNISDSVEVLNFSSLSTSAVTAPDNRTTILLFEASNFSVNYSQVQMVINYSSFSNVVAPAALEVWTCHDTSNCTLTELTPSINEIDGTVTITLSSLASVYGLYQAAFTETETITNTNTVYQSSTHNVNVPVNVNVPFEVQVPYAVIEEVPVEVPKFTSLRLLSGPDMVELKPLTTVSIPIMLTNNAGADLPDITLSVSADSGISTALSENGFSIKKGESAIATLTVTAGAEGGDYSLSLTAKAPSRDLTDTLTLPVSVSKNLESDKKKAQEKINFANKLINDNPECLDLKESLTSAALFIDTGDYTGAERKAQNAVTSCSVMMALRGKSVPIKEIVREPDWTLILAAAVGMAGLFGAAGVGVLMFAFNRAHQKRPEQRRAADSKYMEKYKGSR